MSDDIVLAAVDLVELIHVADEAIGRYAGLTPRVFASGGKERHGHISKTGPRDMRWVLQQAAWTAIRCDEDIKRRWLKIARGSGKKAAAVAIARQLLVTLWQMVRQNASYQAKTARAAATATL